MLNEYAPLGSNRYYSLRYVLQEKSRAYAAFMAWADTLNDIAEQYREPSIAKQKLGWWQDEIHRLFNQKPSHPLTKNLLSSLDALSQTTCEALIEANLLSLQTHIFETRSALFQHYQHLGGLRFSQAAALLNSPCPLPLLHEMGLKDEILRHLIHFNAFLKRQHLYLALEDFQAFSLDPQPILQGQNLPTLPPLLNEYFKCAKPPSLSQEKIPKPLRIEWKLKMKQGQLMQKEGWQFYRHRLELSPLYKLWVSCFS